MDSSASNRPWLGCDGGLVFRFSLHRVDPAMRSDQLCRLALFPVSLGPAHGRGNAGGARDLRDVRNRARVVEEVGKAFSDQIRQRAPVRGDKWHMDEVGHLDCWRAVLAVARRRSKWLRSRRLGPASKRQSRCAAAHEEALEIRRHTAARHDYGQAPFIRRCEGARWAFASNIASTRA